MKKLFYDLETTGLTHWKHGIHQLACIYEDEHNKVTDKLVIDFKPHEKAIIDEEAIKVSGKTIEFIENSMNQFQAYNTFINFLSNKCDKYNKQDKIHLIGYNNSGFDNAFLKAMFVQCGDKYFNSWFWIDTIDVMVLASNKLAKIRHTLPDFKLSTVAKYLKINVDETKLHDALYDIELTKQVYERL